MSLEYFLTSRLDAALLYHVIWPKLMLAHNICSYVCKVQKLYIAEAHSTRWHPLSLVDFRSSVYVSRKINLF